MSDQDFFVRTMDRLQAKQPADKLQSLTIFRNGRARGLFVYGTIEFNSWAELEKFLDYPEAESSPDH